MAEPIHPASSSSWGDEGAARLCKIILESNTGFAQQILENRSDLLDMASDEQLMEPVDDIGMTLPFLCVYYDKPKMIDYLHNRGVSFREYCDPMKFGRPMYYAVTLGKIDIIKQLDWLGYSVKEDCDSNFDYPINHARRMDDRILIDMIEWISGKERRAWTLLRKNYLKARCIREYKYMRATGIPLLQRAVRGMFGRRRARKRRMARDIRRKKAEKERMRGLGLVVSDSEEEEEEEDDHRRQKKRKGKGGKK